MPLSCSSSPSPARPQAMESNGRDFAESIAGDSLVSTDPSTVNVGQIFSNEVPTFEIEQVQLQFSLQNSLKRLCVQSNMMFLITNSTLFKINLENPSNVQSIPVPTVAGDNNEVTNCWLHPNGFHLIVQINYRSYFYLHESYSKFKLISRFKNLQIKFIAFPDDPTSSNFDTTGDFLVGTSDGTIYLSLLKVHDPINQESKRDDKYVKQVYKYSSSSSTPHLYGLTFSNNILINLLVDNQLLSWDCVDTSYSELIKVFKLSPRVTSLPSNTSTKFLFESTSKSFTYIIPSSRDIVSNDQEIQLSQVEKLNSNLPLSNTPNSLISSDHHLLLLDSQHSHLIIFNKLSASDPITIKLNSKINPQEKVLGLVADGNAETYWLFTNNNIYEIVIVNEAISVWYNYYSMGKYEEAIKCLENQDQNNFFKKDMVQIKQGYDFLQKGGFGIEYSSDDMEEDLLNLQIKGIKILAELTEPFEKICLMLLNLQHSLATEPKSHSNYISEILLIEYLQVKFYIAKNSEKNKIRIIVLSSWIIELMLRVLYNLKTELDNSAHKETIKLERNSNSPGTHSEENKAGVKLSMYNSLDKQLHVFLNKNYKVLDAKTIYQIMHEFHCPSKLIAFSELIEDYEFILNYHIDVENWDLAISTIIKIYTKNAEENFESIYKSSTVLLVNSPKKTVETWLKFTDIQYERLIPAILTYNKGNSSIPFVDNYTIQFLLKIVHDKGVKNEYINNSYFSLLITYPILQPLTEKQRTKQIIKLLNHMKNDSGKRSQLYDPDFILRLCLRYKHYQPAVLILIDDMSLFEQALKLALDNELTELAEFVLKRYDEFILNTNDSSESRSFQQDYEFIYNNADTEEDIGFVGKIKLEEESFSSRKKLWMMFAKYLITGICEGKDFKILDIIDDVEFVNDNHLKNGKSNGVQSITNDLVQSMTGDSLNDHELVNQIDLKKLNRVLKYLLNLSYSNNRGSNVLTLKDLLPIFPESIMINNFKDEIVLSLNQYNNRINQLTLEMQESSNIAHQLKTQIKESTYNSNKGKIYTIIEPGEPCKLCDNLLINKNFICFPSCHHSFHKECLVKYYLRLKGDYRFKKVFQNFKKSSSQSSKKELDDIMLKNCVLCNEGNINSIDLNLIDLNKDKAEIDQWVL